MSQVSSYEDLPQSWRQRFSFYDQFGVPNTSPESREGYRRLPLGEKMRLTVNIWGFLFGPIYFFVKGMWRKGLALLALAVALAAVVFSLDAPELLDRVASLIVPALAMTTANYAYYLHVVRGRRSWNPFEGLGRR
ncbi:hypothetical protein NIIDNTM18_08990 [Mycolicibacterium litorale]|uniref:DUF2628 domain-containing protein n=1 Tax=Mycolicibacterium litorale TaxID=758802 RepID=A0A6S6P238_9MYCO|nr:DUF2628 domain-containing protein [Mycolicibacterium litorale]BCI51621.1 hypothetical protein NIIDNTM18_08990 [Mycolicibacterium litorale]